MPAMTLSRVKKAAQRRILPHLYSIGDRVECPICGWTGSRFLPANNRPNRSCPSCHSLQRYRMLYLFLHRRTQFFAGGLTVLDVAPWDVLAARARSVPGLRYLAVDLGNRPAIDFRSDLTRLGVRSGSVDLALCFHVFEHVTDDGAAMRELHRVLSPTGTALVQVPLVGDVTEEDPDASPEDRARRFGQPDHVRTYGWDFVDRLAAAGLTVDRHDRTDYMTAAEADRFHVHGDDRWIFTARRVG